MNEGRCVVRLGTADEPSVAGVLLERAVADENVRAQIRNYLTTLGVLLDRAQPVGWFGWKDRSRKIFAARCADPPDESAPDDGPWDYYVIAMIRDDRSWPNRAVGFGRTFVHSADIASAG